MYIYIYILGRSCKEENCDHMRIILGSKHLLCAKTYVKARPLWWSIIQDRDFELRLMWRKCYGQFVLPWSHSDLSKCWPCTHLQTLEHGSTFPARPAARASTVQHAFLVWSWWALVLCNKWQMLGSYINYAKPLNVVVLFIKFLCWSLGPEVGMSSNTESPTAWPLSRLCVSRILHMKQP